MKKCLLGVTFINLPLEASVFLKLVTRVVKKRGKGGSLLISPHLEDESQL
jgi:hypothetical protein